jgi:predicted PurR-regulated permease PerM
MLSPMIRTPSSSPDLARVTLSVLVLGLLVVTCLWILRPFLGAIVWATMVVVATWPTMLALQARLGGRRWLAIALMTIAMLLVLVLPLAIAAGAIFQHADRVSGWAASIASTGVPAPPAWVSQLPLVGAKVAGEWQRLAAASHDELAAEFTPYAIAAAQWMAGQIGNLGLLLIQFLLTLVITMLLYSTGEYAATGVLRFARRLASDRGEQAVVLAGQAIRAVALGIVVTALVQAVAAGIGLAVCGIPYAAVLASIVFMLCMVQIGPFLVMIPAIIWLFWTGHAISGSVLILWSVVVGVLDNVLRPILIRRGADLPLPLIFAGAIGGLVGLGMVGLFVGPVALAVTYRLLEWWIADIDQPDAGAVPGTLSS